MLIKKSIQLITEQQNFFFFHFTQTRIDEPECLDVGEPCGQGSPDDVPCVGYCQGDQLYCYQLIHTCIVNNDRNPI